MTEAVSLTGEQIKAALPKLTPDELEEVSAAIVKESSRRIREKVSNNLER